MKVIPTIGYTVHGRSGRMEGMTVKETGVLESWSDGGTPDHVRRRMPAIRINCVAAAGLRHCAPGECQGRCGKRPYHASGGVVRCGKRRYASRAFTALSGCGVGKFTGFYRIATCCYRLFPRNSTQVVDFPHLAVVRLFWESPEIGKTTVTGLAGFRTEKRLHAEHQTEINHIYASRYIDFYACNSP